LGDECVVAEFSIHFRRIDFDAKVSA
jgi:hypothetical protein